MTSPTPDTSTLGLADLVAELLQVAADEERTDQIVRADRIPGEATVGVETTRGLFFLTVERA